MFACLALASPAALRFETLSVHSLNQNTFANRGEVLESAKVLKSAQELKKC